MSPDQLTEVLGWMRAAGLSELSYADGNARLQMTLPAEGAEAGPAAAARTPEAAVAAPEIALKSHTLGRFQAADPEAVLAVGDGVTAGQLLGFVECDGICEAVTAPQAGHLTQALPAAGAIVGWGDVIARLSGADDEN
ncbi:biotin/lipoyl-containing protein [Phaeovulum sp. W22_SRMD_FR3]|uniref:biotin/lipoyl-containing protein n=1 Tax=Phaeovulum sp. W22_SRMD_FR3 TaxID=3240274 RepID=UPI003F9A8EBF